MQLPGPVRAALGLAAVAADEAKRLPDRAIELPMLAVSTALQASLRAQQRYARLTARGDAVLSHGRTTDEPPPWATFDDDPADTAGTAAAAAPELGGGDLGRQLHEELFGDSPSAAAESDQYSDGSGAASTPRPASRPGKSVSKPRHTPPSAFDDVDDEPQG